MTRARMISIIVVAVLVVIGGGMYLLSQFGSPDYDAWRGDLVEVVDQAKVKLAEFDQIAVDANTKLSAYRERVQSIEAESGILSRRVADLSRVIQLAKGKLTRLGVLASRGREAVLGDGKKYTAEQLQTLHTQLDMQVMQCVLVRDTMRGESRTARSYSIARTIARLRPGVRCGSGDQSRATRTAHDHRNVPGSRRMVALAAS